MKTLKKFVVILIASFAIAMAAPVPFNGFTLTAEAHSGRTDSSGGHRDNKNVSGLGYYHYHHGYKAHLHPDGVCPYAVTPAEPSTSIPVAPQTPPITPTPSADMTTITLYDSVAFNASYYLTKYKDLYEIFGSDASALYNHFISAGIAEGRQASEQFSVLAYKENNPDLMYAFGDDWIKYYNHYIECGYAENRIAK